MPNDFSMLKKEDINAKAWRLALDCEAWIWKCINKRNVPQADREDVFSICLVEVYKVMLRFNPGLSSKVNWANFGVMKGFLQYDSTSGTIRLPLHIVEKLHRLHRYETTLEQQGLQLCPKDIENFMGMSLIDILTCQEKYMAIRDSSKNPLECFSQGQITIPHMEMINGEDIDAEQVSIKKDRNRHLYRALHVLTDLELFIILHRFGLSVDDIPYRKSFFDDDNFLSIQHYRQMAYRYEDIADLLGMTRERIRQIEKKALSRISLDRVFLK